MNMNKIFDFAPIKPAEETMKRTWQDFGKELIGADIKNLDEAKQIHFLRVFDNAFETGGAKKYFTKKLGDLASQYFYRGAILKGEKDVPFDRFIPKSEFMKNNRFSPVGLEWLYMAISSCVPKAKECCVAECQAKDGDRFGICKFEINPSVFNSNIVDLTVGTSLSYDEINNEMESAARKQVNKTVSKFKKTFNPAVLHADKNATVDMARRWIAQMYTKMMSEMLFVPVEEAKKDDEYIPFQWIARYFESLGYEGIM
jgi:hypothetical protein